MTCLERKINSPPAIADEGQMRDSEEKYRTLYESSKDGIAFYDIRGNIIQANQAFLDMLGYTTEEIKKLSYEKLTPRKWHKGEADIVKNQVLAKGYSNEYEKEYIKKDGTVFPITIRVGLVNNKEGKPTGMWAIVRDITRRKRLRENMQFYIAQITKAQEEERRRIARELHDETLQSLASLSLDIESISKDENRLSGKSILQLEQVGDKIRSIMREVRRYSRELRPDVLDKLGLIPALELLTGELNKERIIEACVETIGREQRLSPEVELVLFRIAQEAVRNIWKHSQATKVVVQVEFSPDKVKLIVTDNGRGFKVPEVLSELAGDGKLGLCGMQERIRLLDASLSVESQLGKGTTIMVDVKILD